MRWALCLIGVVLGGCQTSAESPVLDQLVQDRAKQAVLDSLRDPDSAKFVGQFTRKSIRMGLFGERQEEIVCGRVNSKNGFGAYGGPTQFYFKIRDGLVVMDQFGDPQYATLACL